MFQLSFRLMMKNTSNASKPDLFDGQKNKTSLYTTMIPLCHHIASENQHGVMDFKCAEFIPAFTSHGLCLTRNGDSQDNIFQPSYYLDTFKETFLPEHFKQQVRYIGNKASARQFALMIDGNRYNDLKRGLAWNISRRTPFILSVHSPTDTADTREWENQVIEVKAGYITTIRIKIVQLVSDASVRTVKLHKRGCRFSDENKDLSVFKWYSADNCLLECSMDFAEATCGCRPWDYPAVPKVTKVGRTSKICEFYGSSCFNSILQGNITEECREKCVSNCNDIKYSISIETQPIDEDGEICRSQADPDDALRIEIKIYIKTLLSRDSTSDFDNIQKLGMMNLIKDMLLQTDNSSYLNKEATFEKNCKRKLKYDIAGVILKISPSFKRLEQDVRVSMTDILGSLGKCLAAFTKYYHVLNEFYLNTYKSRR